MSNDQVQQIIDILKNASGKGWDILVRQAVIDGIQDIVIGVLMVSVAIVFARFVPRTIALCRAVIEENRNVDYAMKSEASGGWGLLAVALGVAAIGFTIGAAILITTGLGMIINPGAAAIHNLPGFH